MTWSMAIDLLRGGLFSLAHFCGGSMGLAIIVASLAFRAIMLPLSIRVARRQAAATARTKVPDLGTVVQLPLGIGLYAAIRDIGERAGGFLWIKTLARPDRGLVVIASLVVGGLSWLAGPGQTLNAAPAGSATRNVALGISALLSAGLTLLMLSHLPAGVAVYSITSSVAGIGERRLIARLATKDRARQ